MAYSVRHLTLDFGSAHDLTLGEFEPCIRLFADSAKLAWDSLSLSLPLPHSYSVSISKINKLKKKKNHLED